MTEYRAEKERWMVIEEREMEKIHAVLGEFLKLSGAKCALLIDKDGYLITKHGGQSSFHDDTISALVAGSFAATKEMARLLGEEEFSVLYHQGRHENIQLTLVGDRVLLTVIFDEQTTLGMIRLYAKEAAMKLGEVMAAASAPAGAGSSRLGQGFSASAKDKLDSLFQ
jgi:predicted regulator of Ras-like GTPase activity (Roadblock/LC7/MglB family)